MQKITQIHQKYIFLVFLLLLLFFRFFKKVKKQKTKVKIWWWQVVAKGKENSRWWCYRRKEKTETDGHEAIWHGKRCMRIWTPQKNSIIWGNVAPTWGGINTEISTWREGWVHCSQGIFLWNRLLAFHNFEQN